MRTVLYIGMCLLAAGLKAQQPSLLGSILPDQYHLQYAGSVGKVSLGAGYANRRDNLSFGFAYGYVPESAGGRLDILSARISFRPFTRRLGKSLAWKPLNPVLFVSRTLNRGFHGRWSEEQYPENYYWWNPAYRFHGGFSTDLVLQLPGNYARSYALYAEVNTNDLYLTSYLTNRHYLSLCDITRLGFGLRVTLE